MKEKDITRTIRRQNRWRALSALFTFLFATAMLFTLFILNGPIDWRLFFSSAMAMLMGAMFAWFMGQAQRHDILVEARGMSAEQLADYIRYLRGVHQDLQDEQDRQAIQ